MTTTIKNTITILIFGHEKTVSGRIHLRFFGITFCHSRGAEEKGEEWELATLSFPVLLTLGAVSSVE